MKSARLLSSNQTLKFDLAGMFGEGATTETVASVEIASRNDRTVATTIGRTEKRSVRHPLRDALSVRHSFHSNGKTGPRFRS